MLYKFLPTYPPSLESQIACGLRAQNHEKLPLASASTGNNHEHYCISRFDSIATIGRSHTGVSPDWKCRTKLSVP